MSQRFYTSSDLHPGLVILQGPEAHHLAHVCRYQIGDGIVLFNGNGCEYPARVTRVDRRSVELEITSEQQPQRELPFPLEIAVAVPKGERADWMIEKLTELGVSAFVPLQTQRSVVNASSAKLERWRRLVIEASKQCGRNILMEIRDPLPWSRFCTAASNSWRRYLAHPSGSSPAQAEADHATMVAIGPEGGWTEEELELARANGWHFLGLGPRILRVETAAVACAALLALAVA